MVQHFIITPFSYRSNFYSKRSKKNPIDPKNLDQRFKMFEITCLPSILNQSNQDFIWVLIIDSKLPEKYKLQLSNLINKRENSYLIDYHPELKIDRLDWLKSLIKNDPQYVITSLLDDDDALYSGFTKYIRDHFYSQFNSNKLPPILIYGLKNSFSWDLISLKKSPMGYLKPRSNSKFPSSAGFSLCCKYPELDFSIKKFGHLQYNKITNYSDLQHITSKEHYNAVRETQRSFKERCKEISINWDGIFRENNLHDIYDRSIQAIELNHFNNMQIYRVMTNPDQRITFDKNSLSDFNINFELANDYLKQNKKSLRLLLNILNDFILSKPIHLWNKSLFYIFAYRILGIYKIVKGFVLLR